MSRHYSDADRDVAKLLFCEGKSFPEISRHTGIGLATLHGWSVDGEWKLLRKPKGEIAERAAQSIAAELVANRQAYSSSWGKTAKRLADHAEKADPDTVLAQAKNFAAIHGIVRDVFELGQPETVLNVGILNADLPPSGETVNVNS